MSRQAAVGMLLPSSWFRGTYRPSIPSAERQSPAISNWGWPLTIRMSRPEPPPLAPKFSVSTATTGIISPVLGQGR